MYVPSFLAKQDVTIKITDGTDMNGVENVTNEINVEARVQTTNTFTYTVKGQKVALQAKVFLFNKLEIFNCNVTGKCIINVNEFAINRIRILYNPDGTKNHVVLELI